MKANTENMMTVELYLHPLCWKVLRRDNRFDGRAVTLTRMWQYKLFVSQLRRQNIIYAADMRKNLEKLERGYIYVTEADWNKYGCHMSLDRQALFNEVLYNHERDHICSMVLSAKASEVMNRSQAFDYFLEKRELDPTHLDKENIKKYYARHYRQLEDEYAFDIHKNIRK